MTEAKSSGLRQPSKIGRPCCTSGPKPSIPPSPPRSVAKNKMSSEVQLCNPNKRKRPSASTIEQAVDDVTRKGHSINKTALFFNISRAYLAKIVKKVKASDESTYTHHPNIGNKRIFTVEQENMLVNYLKTSSKMCDGLTRQQTKTLAFEYAEANAVCPDKWRESKIASEDWLKGFISRHKDLAVGKPESTSLSRATSFNKTNVSTFFEKWISVLNKYNFPPHMIFNIDETGCSTIINPPKVNAQLETKQIGQMTSAERGTLVTALFFINAAGGFIPPVFVFPRVNYKNIMLTNGPPGALGLANISGRMNEECFMKALRHFAMHVKPSKDNPALIFMDNHSSHVNLSVIQFVRENSIIIVTFPPHCSHKLQPLDVAVYGPFKTKYRIAINEWMLSNPGKTVTIHQVGQFVKDAYPAAFTPQNITQGFLKTGIYPFNSNVFSEKEFLSSFVTDRPDPSAEVDSNEEADSEAITEIVTNNLGSLSSATPTLSLPTSSGQQLISPGMIRPFSKAGPRKNSCKMSSAVIMDSPERKSKTHDDLSSSDSENEVLSQMRETDSRNAGGKAEKDKDDCIVCNGSYRKSQQEWFQCKLCSGWAHESCGIKGAHNYFCQNCF